MLGRLSTIYHRFSKRELASLGVPRDPETWPTEWREISFKTYPRLPQHALPAPAALKASLREALEGRGSQRTYSAHAHISLSALSTLLHYAAGLREESDVHRFYPSGGARYPIEVYVSTLGNDALPAGLYHYNVKDHALEELGGRALTQEVTHSLTYPFAQGAPTVLVLTAVWERNFVKYKDFGYPIVLLEAGHLGQNIQLIAAALGLKSCPLAGFLLDPLSQTLGVDPLVEAPVHVVALGGV